MVGRLADPRVDKSRLASTGTISPVAGTTSTTVSNLVVGAQSKIMLSPGNAAAWRLFHDQVVPTTPVVATVDTATDGSPKRAFTVTHPAAVGDERIDYIVVAGDLV